MKFLKEAYARLKLAKPKFFSKVRWFGGTLAASGSAFYATLQTTPADVPVWVFKVAEHSITIGAAMIFVASLAVQNPSDIKEEAK